MGALAVDVILEGKKGRIIAYKGGDYVDLDIDEALDMNKEISKYQYEVSRLLSI